jgi:hypothetical protein
MTGLSGTPRAGRESLPLRLRSPRLAIYPLRVLPCPVPRRPASPAERRPEPAAPPSATRPDPPAPPAERSAPDAVRPADRPPPRWDGFVLAGATSRSRTIATTVVGGSIMPSPHRAMTGSEPPSRAIASRCSATSSAAEAPLSARSRPPMAVRGKHQPASRSSGATARAVTTSAATGGPPARSSARPRTTVTVASRPSVVTTSDRKAVRRASGSTRAIRRSGRATASTIPGKPAPDPTSTTEAPKGIMLDITAQLIKCRSQMRGASRGPIRPRTTPSVTSSSAYRTASAR